MTVRDEVRNVYESLFKKYRICPTKDWFEKVAEKYDELGEEEKDMLDEMIAHCLVKRERREEFGT